MSNIINKNDFFAAITGKPVEWDCPEVGTIMVRGLTIVESEMLRNKHGGDGLQIMLNAIVLGMVNPKLDESDLSALQNARPRAVQLIGEKILVLSGVSNDDELEKKAGSGS